MVASLGGLAGVVTNSGSADSLLTVNQSATTTFGGSLLDGATNKLALSLTGSGALILSGTNTYTGGTTIGGGTLQLGNANALGTGGLTANAGVLDLAGFSPMVTSLSGLAGVVTNSGSADSLLTVNQSATTTFGGSLTDGMTNKLALSLTGSGTLIFSGTNTYSGGTTIGGGTLQLGNANALGTGGLTANAGVLDLAGFSPMVASLGGLAGAVTNSGSADSLLTVNQSTTTTFGGSLLDGATNKLALSLTGSGALILSGTNTYTGGTTIGGGTLFVTNSEALANGTSLTIDAGGTFVFDPSHVGAPVMASSTAAVPEPGTLAMLAVAVCGAAVYRHIRSRQRKHSDGTTENPGHPRLTPRCIRVN